MSETTKAPTVYVVCHSPTADPDRYRIKGIYTDIGSAERLEKVVKLRPGEAWVDEWEIK